MKLHAWKFALILTTLVVAPKAYAQSSSPDEAFQAAVTSEFVESMSDEDFDCEDLDSLIEDILDQNAAFIKLAQKPQAKKFIKKFDIRVNDDFFEQSATDAADELCFDGGDNQNGEFPEDGGFPGDGGEFFPPPGE